MNWTKDALNAKAKLFFGKANAEDRDSSYFGMYCAFGLELLARAALANISPTLLADNSSPKNLLYALGLNEAGCKPISIRTNQVIKTCGELIEGFNTDLQNVMTLMTELRNEELHTGGGGFSDSNPDTWMASFYKACQVLGASMGETLETLFGRDIAQDASQIIVEDAEKIKKSVLDNISARRKTYKDDMEKQPDEMNRIIERSQRLVLERTYKGYHKVKCPCCDNDAVIYGRESITSHDKIENDFVKVRKDVTANLFICDVCKLKLTTYAELKCAGLPLHYTNTYQYDPTEYFDIDIGALIESSYREEYSNE